MSSKKPILNFAQALRQKPAAPPEAELPVTQPPSQPEPATQLPTLDTQPATTAEPAEPYSLVTQLPSQPAVQSDERYYPSRVQRRQKSIRLPVNKLEQYEEWQFRNRKRFPDFQDLVEYALDWVTNQPVTQIPSQPTGQIPTLINNDLNNLIINDAKAQRALGKYSQVTGKPATPNDYAAYREVSGLPVEAIERGLEETKRRADKAGKQVNSFKYALNVIREEAAKFVPPAPDAAPVYCDRCRDMNGMYYPDPNDHSKGLAKCRHDGN
jgi:hypothetical protein